MQQDEEYLEKRLQQYEHRAKIAEDENAAIKGSRAYRMALLVGSIRRDLKTNPVGIAKKAAKILFTQPTKLLSRGRNREVIISAIREQTARYQEWILVNEPQVDELRQQRIDSELFAYKPVFSVITPVFNPPVDVLEELIESVLEQTYPYFELCLGNFGDDEGVKELIKKYAAVDDRIKYWEFKENKGIAGNSNQILSRVKGDYIALLDHDDTLSLDALYENAKVLNEKQYDFIYSDKDKIDEKGLRFDPIFKPEFSPEMMLNVNYLTHLNIMKTSTVREVGAWDPETDGAQDWDLFLKVTANNRTVRHISKVLYHWRVIPTSTAASIETKPYALQGQRNAVDKHLRAHAIPAKAYHKKTELFLSWGERAIPRDPLVVIRSSSVASTRYIIRKTLLLAHDAEFLLELPDESKKHLYEDLPHVVACAPIEGGVLTKLASYKGSRSVVFINDKLILQDSKWYENLMGWLSIPGVGASSGRIIDSRELIVDSCGVDSYGTYQPIFAGFPLYYESYIGNSEWVRNMSMLSGVMSATTLDSIKAYVAGTNKQSIFAYFNWLRGKGKRLVLCPHSTAYINKRNDLKPVLDKIESFSGIEETDVYSSPNVGRNSPMSLFDDAPAPTEAVIADVGSYQRDATILAQSYDISQEELQANVALLSKRNKGEIRTVSFFLPSFDAIYAGLMNIFSFAEYLQQSQNLAVTFYISSASSNVNAEKALVVEKIPVLSKAKFRVITERTVNAIQPCDLGIATLWSTAFILAKSTKVIRKCYFIQDNESNFYPKGTLSSLVDLSYQFKFFAIANTPGLLKMYEDQYGGIGTVLQSKVDLSAYYPREDMHYTPKAPYKVFFYARPNMPRNAFELGIAGLKKLKKEMGDTVEIITAGAAWDAKAYGVEGLFTNLGKIQYESVPKLYRSVDAGLMFMFSGHPGVTASELMASGCPVVVNEYDDITWNDLYRDGETCVITKSTASEVARNLQRCLTDTKLRKKLIPNALKKVETFYGNYEDMLPRAYDAIKEYFG